MAGQRRQPSGIAMADQQHGDGNFPMTQACSLVR
jgi:hypothetical protein